MCISYPFATNLSGALSSAMWQEQVNNMVPGSPQLLDPVGAPSPFTHTLALAVQSHRDEEP